MGNSGSRLEIAVSVACASFAVDRPVFAQHTSAPLHVSKAMITARGKTGLYWSNWLKSSVTRLPISMSWRSLCLTRRRPFSTGRLYGSRTEAHAPEGAAEIQSKWCRVSWMDLLAAPKHDATNSHPPRSADGAESIVAEAVDV